MATKAGTKVQAQASPAIRLVLPTVLPIRGAAASIGLQLAQTLREAIHRGQLAGGTRLPPSRDAARQLGVGRNAIVEAYEHLAADGLLEARGRRGSFVAAHAARQPAREDLVHHSARKPAERPVPPPHLDWRLGQTGGQLLPLKVWRTACREAGRHLPPAGYGDPRGLQGLRQSIAEWLRQERGVHYEPEQIIVTQGAGAAIDLLVRFFVRPGDRCVVEAPGYPRALLAMQRAGAQVAKVAVDAQGMDVELAFEQPPRLLHMTPSHQYPTGARLSGARRRLLAQLVMRDGAYLIENEYDHEFIFEGQNHAPLAASIPDHTLLVSTFAKAISPALRIGFVAAPVSVAEGLSQAIEQSRSHVSWPVQVSMQWLLRSGQMQRHLRRIRRHYAKLRQQLLQVVGERCPGLRVRGQEGGLHIALNAGTRQRDQRLIRSVRQAGVLLDTLRDFGGAEDALLLGYGHMSPKDVEAACGALALAWQRCR